MVTLGIDVGTSSVKALAMREDGEVLGLYPVVYSRSGEGARARRDPSVWWAAVCEAVKGCLGRIPPGEAVGSVGLSGHMSSVVLIDRDRRGAVRPALLLADPQGVEEIEQVDPGLRGRIEAASRNPLNTAFSVAKLLWLKRNAPADLARADAWLAAKDYVRMMLTGGIGTDRTDAYNSLLLRPGSSAWEWDWIEDLGLPALLFPQVHDSTEVIGCVTATAASETGLVEGTPVVAGAADMACAAVGSGAVREGRFGISLGTSTTVIAPLGEGASFEPGWLGKLTYHPLPPPGGHYALGSLFTGGLALDWLSSLTGAGRGDIGAAAPDPAGDLVFLPYLSGSGTPLFDSRMRGAFFGISTETTAKEIAAALFEAVAFDLRGVIELLGGGTVGEVRACGGGANIDPWMQAIADITGYPVKVLRHKEVSALGAALLAAEGAWSGPGDPSAVDRLVERVQVGETYQPRTGHAEGWERKRRRYADAFSLSRAYYERWAEQEARPSEAGGNRAAFGAGSEERQ